MTTQALYHATRSPSPERWTARSNMRKQPSDLSLSKDLQVPGGEYALLLCWTDQREFKNGPAR